MKRQVREIAAAIGARVIGSGDVEVNGISSIGAAEAGDLVFVEDEENLSFALQSHASVIIVGTFAEGTKASQILLITAHPRLAFARAGQMLRDKDHERPRVHPSAVIDRFAKIGEDVSVGPNAMIDENTNIGKRTRIGAGCVIGKGVEIGDDCEIHPNVTIYSGTGIGNHVIVHSGAVLGSDGFGYVRDPATGGHAKFPQIGRLEIEDDAEIGANSTIDRGALETTRIGRGTKIDNLVHIGHNCQIGENVIIAAQAGFSGSIVIEDNVVIGGQVGVGEHARIKEGVMLGGQSGILPKKILRGKGVAFWGTPAKPLREYLRELAALARLGKK